MIGEDRNLDNEREKRRRAFLADPDSEEKARALWSWIQRLSLRIDGRSLNEVLEDLQCGDWTKVMPAATMLSRLGPELLWPMSELLQSENSVTRWGVLFVLENIGAPARLCLKRLKTLVLTTNDWYSASRAIAALELPEGHAFLLEQIQTHPSPNARHLILRGLSGDKNGGAARLAEYLDHKDPVFVYHAMEELSYLEGAAKEQVPKILSYVNSENRPLRKLARRTLKRIMCS